MRAGWPRWATAALLVAVVAGVASVLWQWLSVDREQPIRIGFVNTLTGKDSDIGFQTRNGAMLAMDDLNRRGGINGRRIELITRDDRMDPRSAAESVNELIDQGAVAIIGPGNSSMARAMVPIANRRRTVLISPTVSMNELAGVDDYFLRVITPNIQQTDFLAAHAHRVAGLRTVAALYDLSNGAYSEEWLANFKKTFERLGGRVVAQQAFRSGSEVRFGDVARQGLDANPDGLVIVAGAIDTAMICQQVRLAGSSAAILISGWAQTPDLLSHGGPAVEGVLGTMYVDYDSTLPRYLAFKDRFRATWGRTEPTFASIFAYEALMVVAEALAREPDPAKLKDTILARRRFEGLQDEFEIDRFGDGRRRAYIVTVRANRFAVLKP